jgi:hypothetical protein
MRKEIEPPGGTVGSVQHGLRGQRRRDRHAIADVAQPGPAHRGVHRDHQRIHARLGCTVDQRQGLLPVGPEVKLEPVAAIRRCSGDILDGSGAHGGERVGDAGRGRGPGAGVLALGLHHPGKAGGSDAYG